MPNIFHCSADLANLAAARNFIREAAFAAGADEDTAYDLTLAVDEVITNIITHGYQHAPGEIWVEALHTDHTLKVIIRDQSPPFDPRHAPEPDLHLPLEERRAGGVGIFLVRNLMDEMEYTSGPEGNALVLIKRIG